VSNIVPREVDKKKYSIIVQSNDCRTAVKKTFIGIVNVTKGQQIEIAYSTIGWLAIWDRNAIRK